MVQFSRTSKLNGGHLLGQNRFVTYPLELAPYCVTNLTLKGILLELMKLGPIESSYSIAWHNVKASVSFILYWVYLHWKLLIRGRTYFANFSTMFNLTVRIELERMCFNSFAFETPILFYLYFKNTESVRPYVSPWHGKVFCFYTIILYI